MQRRRHGRGQPRDRAQGDRKPQRSRALEPLKKPRRLDLNLPATEPLAPEEVAEMNEHVAFLRQFKHHLKLSLNAAEDLLINGAKPPSDRGLAKHLLSKIDRKLVERTLAREAFKSDAPLRARFLAGVVRLNPEISVLLWYLEALGAVGDKREAAAAFWLTVDRIDFREASPAQMSSLLEVVEKTFVDHDRTQAFLGLLASDTFDAALDRALGAVSRELRELFEPLRAAHRVVTRGAAISSDDDERALLDRGIAVWLAAPDRVLRSYPLEVRSRLAELAIEQLDLGGGAEVPRGLLDSLPHGDPTYARLALARAEQLLKTQDLQAARALLSQLAQAHPKLTRAVKRQEALSWQRVGRVMLAPNAPEGRLRPAFWLDGSSFAYARVVTPEHVGRLTLEAQIQIGLILPGVVPALAHGVADDAKAFVVLATRGRPIERAWIDRLPLTEALMLALEGVRILRALALSGVEIPDARLERFLLERGGPAGLRFADFDGAKRGDPAAIAMTHGTLARAFAEEVLSSRADLPASVRARLRGSTPLPVLARVLIEQTLRIDDSR